jgi:hypothetical protein
LVAAFEYLFGLLAIPEVGVELVDDVGLTVFLCAQNLFFQSLLNLLLGFFGGRTAGLVDAEAIFGSYCGY